MKCWELNPLKMGLGQKWQKKREKIDDQNVLFLFKKNTETTMFKKSIIIFAILKVCLVFWVIPISLKVAFLVLNIWSVTYLKFILWIAIGLPI